ncbi:MAG TPA: 50S ribosomal protein L25, partial [Gammaproteobacteria bacterium]|nr:50S ribosomal protein L25 [Gammaproteobacteria bacterium]
FQRVSATQNLVRFVPVHFINEDIAPGVKAGGIVSHHVTEVEIRCLPKNLPEFIAFDLSNAQINEVYHLSDLTLPEGVELVDISAGHEDNKALVSIHLPRGSVAEETPEQPTPTPEAGKADKKA